MGQPTIGVSQELFRQIRGSEMPGMEPEVVEQVLRGYFSGKRSAIRTCKLIDAEVFGAKGAFNAMTVDISSTGVLLRIMDPTFASPEEMQYLMPYTARVWYHFEGGFEVAFAEGAVIANADVVRVTGYCGRGAALILVGCRFRDPLTREQAELLGIEYGLDRAPGLQPSDAA